jgi:hypothetical protein
LTEAEWPFLGAAFATPDFDVIDLVEMEPGLLSLEVAINVIA